VQIEEEEEEEEEDDSLLRANREQASKLFRDVLGGMGLTAGSGFTQAEIDLLFGSIETWIGDGWADGPGGGDNLLMLFRTSKETEAIYQKRFPGMKSLSSRGQAISEGEYIRLEGSLRDVLSSYDLPTRFYDSFDDYGRFIAGGVSPNEVEARVIAAKSAMNPAIAAELNEYYGIDGGTATAFLLGLTDEKGIALDVATAARNQQTLRDINRNIQIGGLAEASGFGMDRSQSEMLAGTVTGQSLDPFDQRTSGRLQETFGQARRIADRENVLAGIDQEAYTEQDTLQAAFGDEDKRLASEKRGKRERSRFAGSSGVARSSLSVSRNL
jgi:hypothetical protein